MNLRRWIAGALLLFLLAPVLVAGPGRKGAGVPASGMACCGSAACCAGGGAGCAEGRCAMSEGAGSAPTERTAATSFVAGCGGATPMTVASDRDPMDFSLHLGAPGELVLASTVEVPAVPAPLRALAPADPPPRA